MPSILFDRDVSGLGTESEDFEAVGKSYDVLNDLAEASNVSPLSSFVRSSQDEARAFAEENGLDVEEVLSEMPPTEWIDPGRGIETVEALIKAIDRRPKLLGRNRAKALRELARMRDVLQLAVKCDAQFGLSVYFEV